MQKEAARKILLDQRKQLSELDCIKLDDLLLIQFQQLDFTDTHFVGSYFPMESQSEPNIINNTIEPDTIGKQRAIDTLNTQEITPDENMKKAVANLQTKTFYRTVI